MPQVPNRYFNNQVIADVGRNLSLAIAGDPERDAARLQMKMTEAQMSRQNDADILAREDRARVRRGQEILGQIPSAAEADVPRLMSEAITSGMPTKEVFDAGATASPIFRQKLALLQQQGTNAKELQDMRGTIQTLVTEMQQGGMDRRNERNAGVTERGQDLNLAGKKLALAVDWAKLAKDKDGKQINLPQGAREALAIEAISLAMSRGGKLSKPDFESLLNMGSVGWQASGNPITAMREAFDRKFGPKPQQRPGESTYWGFGADQPGEFIAIDGTPIDVAPPPGAAPAVPAVPASAMPGGGNFWDAIQQTASQPSAPAMPPMVQTASPPMAAAAPAQLSSVVAPAARQMSPASISGRGIPVPARAAPPAPAPAAPRPSKTVRVNGRAEAEALIAAKQLTNGDFVILPNGDKILIEMQ